MKLTDEQFDTFLWTLQEISHGGSGPGSSPKGLEALTMAMAGAGTPGHDSLAAALREIAEKIDRHADVMADISDTLRLAVDKHFNSDQST